MKRKSKVDGHPRQAEIEAALAAPACNVRAVARRFGVPASALYRYERKLRRDSPQLFAALAAQDWKVRPEDLEQLRIETADGWLRQLRDHHSKLVWAFDRNLAAGNDGIAAQLSAQIMKALVELGRATGELAQHAVHIQNNVVLAPGYWKARIALLDALAPFPDARAAAIRALRDTETVDGNAEPLSIAAPRPEADAA